MLLKKLSLGLIAVLLAGACSGCGQYKEPEAPRVAAAVEPAVVSRVIDGDTLELVTKDGEERCRLIGIDAPESVHPDETRNTEAGNLASTHLKEERLEGRTVYLQQDTTDRDSYGRLLRYVWTEIPIDYSDAEARDKMLNAEIVSDGYAEAKRYEPDTEYAALFDELESEARAAGNGLHAAGLL